MPAPQIMEEAYTMKDQPQGSVFGGYGFMQYRAPHHPQHPQHRADDAGNASGFRITAVAQWLRACWPRR